MIVTLQPRCLELFLKLGGKIFQANCDKDDKKHKDINGNGCDWYIDDQNFQQCGEHDVMPNFIAEEMCCSCKDISGVAKTVSFTSAETILECHFLQEKNEDGNGLLQ